MDQAILRWRPTGRIFLWRYHTDRRDYGGLHFTADESGLSSLTQLIELMRAATHRGVANMDLSRPGPSERHVPTDRLRATAMTTWTIVHDSRRFAASHWLLAVDSTAARLEVGADRLEELVRGFTEVGQGRGDYSIGDDEGLNLWFWWRAAGA